MARRGIKKQEHEKLDDSTISRVVSLLEQDNPITKKAACEILNISYNTTRLAKIIQEHKDKIEYTKKRFKANKGKPFSDLELKEIVINYLSGESITNIAKNSFRSLNVIKNKIKELNLPLRSTSANYFNPDMIPDEAVSDQFSEKELVWSSRYNSVAEIKKSEGLDKENNNIYLIWVFGKHNQFALQPAYELGKLEVLKQFSLRDDEFQNTEKPNFNYRID